MPSPKDTTRHTIIDNARKVFASKGYRGASMLDIARVCGVGVGTIYNYFGNKRALFESVVAPGQDALGQLWVCDDAEIFYKTVMHCRSELRLMLLCGPDDYGAVPGRDGNLSGLSVNVCRHWLYRLLEEIVLHRSAKALALSEITEYIMARRVLRLIDNNK